MSTLSIKRRVVAVATLAAGLQGGVLAPSMAVDTVADPTPSLHDIAGVGDLDDPLMQRRDGETNVDLDDPNDGDITLTIHHEKGTALLIWSGLPAELSAESMLADVALCTSTDKCTHRSVSLTEGGSHSDGCYLRYHARRFSDARARYFGGGSRESSQSCPAGDYPAPR